MTYRMIGDVCCHQIRAHIQDAGAEFGSVRDVLAARQKVHALCPGYQALAQAQPGLPAHRPTGQ